MTDARLEQEALLEAWMAMTAWIRGNRLLETFSMNEMLILSALVRRQELGGPMLTATELCQTTRLLKSQINPWRTRDSLNGCGAGRTGGWYTSASARRV